MAQNFDAYYSSFVRFRRLAVSVVLAILSLPAPALAKRVYRVTITRDSAGLPHITAHDFGSLGYGEGYAFAQDNLCVFAEDAVTLRSERTRYFGARGVAVGYANGASDPNPVSDLYWAWVRTSGRIARLTRHVLPQVRAVYAGWAAGYNAWLRSRGFRDPTCKGKPWVKPVTVQDLYLRGYQIETFPSSGSLESGIVDAQPPAGNSVHVAATAARSIDVAGLRRRLGEAADPGLGSNAIGVGSQGTRPGIEGMVLANPHFPWRGTERFWMMQLTVPGQYDMLGGTLFGFPLVGIGFNRHLAFTSTNATGYRFVPIQLKLVPGDPTAYVVDGHKLQMGRRAVRANGVSHTFYSTEYGPVFDACRSRVVSIEFDRWRDPTVSSRRLYEGNSSYTTFRPVRSNRWGASALLKDRSPSTREHGHVMPEIRALPGVQASDEVASTYTSAQSTCQA